MIGGLAGSEGVSMYHSANDHAFLRKILAPLVVPLVVDVVATAALT